MQGDSPYAEVIPAFEQAMARWRRLGHRKELMTTTGNLVGAYIAKGDLREAMRLSRETLASLQSPSTRDDIEHKHLFLVYVALIASSQGEQQQAINARRAILEDARQPRGTIDADPQVALLINNAWSHQAMGEHQKALAALAEAKNVRRRHPDPSSLATILSAESFLLLGTNLQQASARLQEALAALSALPAAEASDKRKDMGVTAFSIAGWACAPQIRGLRPLLEATEARQRQRQRQAALPGAPSPQQGLVAEGRRRGSWASEQAGLSADLPLLTARGAYAQALRHNQRRLELSRLMGSPGLEAEALSDLASIHQLQGQPQQALEALHQALTIQERLRLQRDVVSASLTIGDVYKSLGADGSSLAFYQRAQGALSGKAFRSLPQSCRRSSSSSD